MLLLLLLETLPADDVSQGVGHMITVVLPHVLVVMTTLLNFFQSRRNSKEIHKVNEVLNGTRENRMKAYRPMDK